MVEVGTFSVLRCVFLRFTLWDLVLLLVWGILGGTRASEPVADHCAPPPVLCVSMQAWSSAWRRGELLMAPESGHDFRLIRTVSAAAAGEAAAGAEAAEAAAAPAPPLTVEQLLDPSVASRPPAYFASNVSANPVPHNQNHHHPDSHKAGSSSSSLPAACAAALQQGFTLALREASHRWWPAARLVEELEGLLGLPAGCNLYLTPPGEG